MVSCHDLKLPANLGRGGDKATFIAGSLARPADPRASRRRGRVQGRRIARSIPLPGTSLTSPGRGGGQGSNLFWDERLLAGQTFLADLHYRTFRPKGGGGTLGPQEGPSRHPVGVVVQRPVGHRRGGRARGAPIPHAGGDAAPDLRPASGAGARKRPDANDDRWVSCTQANGIN